MQSSSVSSLWLLCIDQSEKGGLEKSNYVKDAKAAINISKNIASFGLSIELTYEKKLTMIERKFLLNRLFLTLIFDVWRYLS